MAVIGLIISILNSIRLKRLVLLGVAFIIALPAQAGHPADKTEAEMAMVPAYCRDTMAWAGYGDASHNTSPRAGHWIALMGNNFWNMHHYCWAQVNRMRATRSGVRPDVRKSLLEGVVADYVYSIDKAPKDFILAPEILTRLGEVYLMLGKTEQADKAFAQAREKKLDYWPAYSRWSEHLMASGRRAEAKALVKSGLEYAPKAKVLQEQYRILGGKLSEIVPKPLPIVETDELTAEDVQAKGSTEGDKAIGEKPAGEAPVVTEKGM